MKYYFPEELKKYYINYDEQNPTILKVPNITVLLAEGTKASNTKNLNFKPLEKPVKLVGRFGYWIKVKNDEYLSYEPYSKDKKYNILMYTLMVMLIYKFVSKLL